MRGRLAKGCGGCLLAVLASLTILLVLGRAAGLGSRGEALVVVAATVPAVLYALILTEIDRYEREPVRLLLAAFLWGALIATFIASLFNDLAIALLGPALGSRDLGRFVTAVTVAPVVEESAKGIVLLLLAWNLRNEFDDLVDGVVYGSLVGIGFAMTENILYYAEAYPTGDLLPTFYVRSVLDGLGHAGYTALLGAGIGYAQETSATSAKLLAPFLGWIAAIVAHASWNLLGGLAIGLLVESSSRDWVFWLAAPVVALFLTGPVLLVLSVVLVRAWRREARVVSEYLRDEVRAGVLSEAAYRRISSSHARRRAEWERLRSQGWRAWLALRRFHQAATELAFANWRAGRGICPERVTDREALRASVRELGLAAGDAVGG